MPRVIGIPSPDLFIAIIPANERDWCSLLPTGPSLQPAPQISLVEPPVLPLESECTLEVHLSSSASVEQGLRIVCTQDGRVIAEVPLTDAGGKTAR